jgi:hypothetical protein
VLICTYPSFGIAVPNFVAASHIRTCILSAIVISGVTSWPEMYNSRSEESVARDGEYQLIPLKF